MRELSAVRESFVPVIKFQMQGVSIDLLYAQLQLAHIPDDLSLQARFLLPL